MTESFVKEALDVGCNMLCIAMSSAHASGLSTQAFGQMDNQDNSWTVDEASIAAG